jgi:hypothetical protein
VAGIVEPSSITISPVVQYLHFVWQRDLTEKSEKLLVYLPSGRVQHRISDPYRRIFSFADRETYGANRLFFRYSAIRISVAGPFVARSPRRGRYSCMLALRRPDAANWSARQGANDVLFGVASYSAICPRAAG